MKPYMLIEGSHDAIEAFELKVTRALEAGYTFAGELVTQAIGSQIKLYQPVVLEDEDYEEDEDEEEDEEESEDEE